MNIEVPHPFLSSEEQEMLITYIAEGKLLPAAYRNLLFADNSHQRGNIIPQEQVFIEHAATELLSVSSFEQDTPPTWLNHLFLGDNKCILAELRAADWQKKLQRYGGIRLAYVDPPFTVGTDFSMSVPIRVAASEVEQSVQFLRQKAYSDIWDQENESFWTMIRQCFLGIYDLLAEDGSLYVHCDWRTVAHMRLLLDSIFGPERFLDEIIWHYTGGGRSKRYFSRKHDTILHYTKTNRWIFNRDAVRVPYKPTSGYAKGGIISAAGKKYLPHPKGTPVDDVWDIPIVNPLAKERTGYPTQKPLALLERIIAASSNPGDIVADFFCGSGTTLLAAQKLGRKWIGTDKGCLAIATCRKRLLSAQQREPFAVWHSTAEVEEKNAVQPCPWREKNDPNAYAALGVYAPCSQGGFCIQLRHVDMALPLDVTSASDMTRNAPSQRKPIPAMGLVNDSRVADWRSCIAFWAVGIVSYIATEGQEAFVPLWESEPGDGAFETPLLSGPADTPFFVQVTDIFGRVHWGRID